MEIDQRPELQAGNQWMLGKRFRSGLIKRILKLAAQGKLNLSGKLEFLQDPTVRKEWLDGIAPHGFRVFVQPPPSDNTDPEVVLKYLAAYVSGGPISNGRLVSRKNGQVTFRVRSQERPVPGRRREKVDVTIPETEFVRRWALARVTQGLHPRAALQTVRQSTLRSVPQTLLRSAGVVGDNRCFPTSRRRDSGSTRGRRPAAANVSLSQMLPADEVRRVQLPAQLEGRHERKVSTTVVYVTQQR